MKHITCKLLSILGLMVSAGAAHAQDTIRLTLPDAEKQFTEKNLQLLAEKYNIDIATAGEMQAKLYNNPNLSLTANAYDPQNKKVLNVSNSTGQYEIALQQMIRLAGKRNKEIKLAETNTTISKARFYDLLRTLRFSLRSDFYSIYFLQSSMMAYQEQITSLERMDTAYNDLQKKGVVSLKDAIRIRSLLYSLKAEVSTLQNQVNDVEAELQLLLANNKAYYLPQQSAVTTDVSAGLHQLKLQDLVDSAYSNRYDLKLAQANTLYAQQNFALQKALAVPDLTVGANFDKRGSFVDNASFISLAMDLPFFNRNQGNIKAAKISIDQSKVATSQQQLTVENDVQHAYVKALNTDKLLQNIDPSFGASFQRLLQGITENFQKKNISLIEFTDFYESYKDNILQFNQLQNDRMQSIEALNFSTGTTVINN